MNPFPLAPNDLSSGGFLIGNKDAIVSGMPITNGAFYRQVQWKQAAERALLFDGAHPYYMTYYKWTFAPEGTVAFPDRPFTSGTVSFPIDFNRHGKKPLGNAANAPSLNVLFCDGHADTASARTAFRAIRFN
jgi:prepilin-type processing-associated H-X9-DG protein